MTRSAHPPGKHMIHIDAKHLHDIVAETVGQSQPYLALMIVSNVLQSATVLTTIDYKRDADWLEQEALELITGGPYR